MRKRRLRFRRILILFVLILLLLGAFQIKDAVSEEISLLFDNTVMGQQPDQLTLSDGHIYSKEAILVDLKIEKNDLRKSVRRSGRSGVSYQDHDCDPGHREYSRFG